MPPKKAKTAPQGGADAGAAAAKGKGKGKGKKRAAAVDSDSDFEVEEMEIDAPAPAKRQRGQQGGSAAAGAVGSDELLNLVSKLPRAELEALIKRSIAERSKITSGDVQELVTCPVRRGLPHQLLSLHVF